MNYNGLIRLYVVGSLVLTILVFFLIGFVLLHERRLRLEKAELKNKYRNDLLTEHLLAQEEAMKHLSHELHDNVGQTLALVHFNIYSLIDKIDNIAYKEYAAGINELLMRAIKDIINISHSYNARYVNEAGLKKGLENELNYIAQSKNIECNLQVEGQEEKIDPLKEVVIYRIAQEALHNVLKHANAEKIDITLTFSSEGLTLAIADNGSGFNIEEPRPRKGIGLQNMHDRAAQMNANLAIVSAPGEGTRIKLSVDNYQTVNT